MKDIWVNDEQAAYYYYFICKDKDGKEYFIRDAQCLTRCAEYWADHGRDEIITVGSLGK